MPNLYYEKALELIRDTGGIGRWELTRRLVHGDHKAEENRSAVNRLSEALAELVRRGRVAVEADGPSQFCTPNRGK